MLMTLSIAPLHSVCPDDQQEMQNDFLDDVMPLVLASTSCNADNINSHTISSLGQDDKVEVQHDFFGHVTLLVLSSYGTTPIRKHMTK